MMAQAQLPFQHQILWEKERSQTHLPTQEQPDWDDLQCQKLLKLVLKWEIQNLIQRLADAGEEALILTANISEDSTHVLGSQFGEKFVLQSDLALLKHQFLKYCRVHCKKRAKKSSPGAANKRKSTVENNSGGKRQKKVLHHIVRQEDSSNSNNVSPLRDDFKERKETDDKSNYGSPSITSLTAPIVPLSKGNSSRRKHTPKRVVPSLPASQSDSDTEDNDLDLNTIIKVEVNDGYENDLYGESQNQIEDFKSDYFDPDRTEDKNGYFDPFKSDCKNEFIDCLKSDRNELMDTFKGGNLSDDSTIGLFNSLFNGNDYQNNSGSRKDPVLSQIQKARKSTKNRKRSLGGYHKSGNLSDDSSVGLYGSFMDINGFQNTGSSDAGKDTVQSPVQKARQSFSKGCDSYMNGSLSGYTNTCMESDSDHSGLDGLTADAVSLHDSDNLSHPGTASLSALPNMYTDPEVNTKLKVHGLDLSRKGSPGTGKDYKSTTLTPEDPVEANILDQARRGVRKYECPICSLMVRDRHDLKRHLLTHTKEKPYSCDRCNKKFTRKWDQKNHLKKHEQSMLREAHLAKESEYQVTHNIDTINKLARKVEMQKHVLGKKGLVYSEDSGVSDSRTRDDGLSFSKADENGSYENSPVKRERDFADGFS